MKILIVQKNINNSDFISFLDDLKDSNQDLVVFGELALSGCLYDGAKVEDFLSIEKLKEQLSEYQFAVMLGLPRWENGKMFNTYLYHKDGYCQMYDKINLFEPMNEAIHFQAGEKPGIFDTEFGKFGISICYDIRFPKLYDKLKEAEAEILFIPAAFPRVRVQDWRNLLKERALQTRLTVVGINAVGNDGTIEFGGTSMVIDGQGRIIAQLDEITESIIEVEL